MALAQSAPRPRSLVWATQLDVLPLGCVIERNDGYLAIRSPSNPAHYWGNLLLFDQSPLAGDGPRWEALFEREFGGDPRVRHRTFAWDRVDAELGAAGEEFVGRGYDLEESVGLVAERGELHPHGRENREVSIRTLGAAPGADEELWEAVVELQVANRDPAFAEGGHRVFVRARIDDLRARFRAGCGAWYAALAGASGEVVASCGVVVTGERARFQSVETARAYRRRGICSRLVVEAAARSAVTHGAERFVIVADPAYHALPLYESLGFSRREHVLGVCRKPGAKEPTS